MELNINYSEIHTFGSIVLLDEIPHLFILNNETILDGIPLFDDSEIYLTLNDNEMVIVGVEVKDDTGEIEMNISDITDDNYDELEYVLTPLKFYTLKNMEISIDDVMNMEFFDILVASVVNEYKEKLKLL